ncbi:RteC protein [Dysgonomonas sp. 521]|uniref:RteC domain-containing protein n=1 Tax=Dysgonomonas sp. 521 TaxID=2302932 RepID=UPI0013D89C66|nr:RteC domain-containing protein [Dysgonomonas sp. 521]NDV97077.1 RteC protein [Dysgonomonas sp. 521]
MNTRYMTINITESQFVKLKSLINNLHSFFLTIDGNKPETKLYWSGSKSDFVELAYGLLETNSFNNGDIEIQEAIGYLCQMLSFPVANCYDVFRAIRRRTDSRTLFLDEIKTKLNKRMDDMDNGIFKKKRK